ncbi:M9 family metallopeptidase [Chitinimonas sp. BJB300]|uniref:M9 family metallopeptidase n=1 Tax=Chitinimonas sp. BJB300 TaxID=1559339 RepID=UPI000C0DE349|nr:M9 family metallopeptidase [Chitinimonas sp. BJB300]PHV13520.1 hypothetical protein CSQ89_00355 [Chitinimonas sp. BJB300]TSJ89797.1 hypothetical protein FG002_006185 [Chitinimonas sp. BJB300]
MDYRLNARSLLVTALALAFGGAQAALPPSASVLDQVYPEKRHSVVGTVTKPLPSPISAEVANPEMARKRVIHQAIDETCRIEDFAAARGDALVTLVKSKSVACVNQLYTATGRTAHDALAETQMVNIAAELKKQAQSYDGTNSSQIQQIVAFMRAGYYVQWYNRDDVGEYGPALKAATRAALDTLFANPATRQVTEENGGLLSEAITLIDSAAENARYLPIALDLLKRSDDSYYKLWSMRNAVNNVFTVLFRGHQNDDFVEAVRNDPTIIEALSNFYRQRFYLRGTDSQFMLVNAVNEAGRFMKYTERKSQAQTFLRTVLSENEMVGLGAPMWLGAATMVDAYDSANCSYYGTCNFRETLKTKVLSNRYECSPSLKILAQDMTVDQFKQSCALIGAEEKLFHYGMFASADPQSSKPVPNDKNTALEVVVFDDYSNYSNYAGVLFGIATNNGGMYLEGNPADPNNQARFIAHEASWNRPKFQVWNLEHEYIHYLDGRYNMEGDFTKTISANTVWWVEGVGEYYSHQNEYPEAIVEARKKTYLLSVILSNVYGMGDYANRAYRWGYLAVRFMFERHRDDVEKALAFTRTGDYAGYTKLMNAIGTRYDAEFTQWLDMVNPGGEFAGGKPSGGGGSGNCPTRLDALGDGCTRVVNGPNNAYYYVNVPAGTKQLNINTRGGTGNADLYVQDSKKGWPTESSYLAKSTQAGNEENVVINAPVPGYYHLLIRPNSTYAGLSLTATFNNSDDIYSESNCPANSQALADRCLRPKLSGSNAYFWVFAPKGAKRITLRTEGGMDSDVALYVKTSSWPTQTDYQFKSQAGTLVLDNMQGGDRYFHILLQGKAPYKDVNLKARVE